MEENDIELPEISQDVIINLVELKSKKISEILHMARDLNIEGASTMTRQELIFALLQAHTEQNGVIYGVGVLETLPDGFGFLRAPDYSYLPGPDDIYVSPSQIRRFSLQNRRYHIGPDSSPERGRAVLRPSQGRIGKQ